jgi:hypothetical protein
MAPITDHQKDKPISIFHGRLGAVEEVMFPVSHKPYAVCRLTFLRGAAHNDLKL